nr:aldo/keto reductase [Lysinibacillus timonensis]
MGNKVQLGRTDLYVNPIGLGTNAVGGHNLFQNLNDEDGRQLVRTGIHHGINFIDSAFIYGLGRSEEIIGEVVKEIGNRSELVIATKVAHKLEDGKVIVDNSPSFLREEVEKSLKRLQTDYIDLMYIHFPDESTPKDEAVGVLKQLKDEGKIRAIGLSNFSLDQLKEANKDGYVDVLQGEYNLINREAELSYFPYVLEQNSSFVPYFPLASGLLTGKYKKDSFIPEGRQKYPQFQGETYLKNVERVDHLREIATSKGVEVANVVLSWYLTRNEIDVVIPGAKRAEQVLDNLKTLEVNLTKDEIGHIEQVFAI